MVGNLIDAGGGLNGAELFDVFFAIGALSVLIRAGWQADHQGL